MEGVQNTFLVCVLRPWIPPRHRRRGRVRSENQLAYSLSRSTDRWLPSLGRPSGESRNIPPHPQVVHFLLSSPFPPFLLPSFSFLLFSSSSFGLSHCVALTYYVDQPAWHQTHTPRFPLVLYYTPVRWWVWYMEESLDIKPIACVPVTGWNRPHTRYGLGSTDPFFWGGNWWTPVRVWPQSVSTAEWIACFSRHFPVWTIKECFSLLTSDTELKSCVFSNTETLPSCHHETLPASRHTTSSFKQMNISCFVSAHRIFLFPWQSLTLNSWQGLGHRKMTLMFSVGGAGGADCWGLRQSLRIRWGW